MGDATFAFERAVLSKGDYLSYTDKEKKNLLNTSNTNQNIKRDHSWKRYLRCDGFNENVIKLHNFVKDVLDDTDLDLLHDGWHPRVCRTRCPGPSGQHPVG